jgi:hypothetical protein
MTLNDSNDLPLPNLQALILRHGTLAVGFAYLRAALIRKPRPPDAVATVLSDHILRDIGLMPRVPTAKADRQGWDL